MTRADGERAEYLIGLRKDFRESMKRSIKLNPLTGIVLSTLSIEGYDITISPVLGEDEAYLKAIDEDPEYWLRLLVWDEKPLSEAAMKSLGTYLEIGSPRHIKR